MSLKKCVLKKVFKEVLQPAFIAALPPYALQKLLCCISVHYFTTYSSYFMKNKSVFTEN